MKRSNEDAARVIKIADPAANTAPVTVTSTAGAAVVMPAGPPASTVATGPFFATTAGRQTASSIITTEIMSSQQQTFTRVITPGGAPAQALGGVSVYKDSGSGPVAITPAATAAATVHPVSATTTVVTQPPSNIKPEQITLPTAPVSVQYPNFPPKTLQSSSLGNAGSAQAIVNTLTTQQNAAHQQQIVQTKVGHQTVSYVPNAVRSITTASLPTIPNPPHVVQTAASLGVSAVTLPTTAAQASTAQNMAAAAAASQGNTQFQRLKVEDALSYLDQVKFKFGNQPQVYNDFLDIMKEFKSQTIDTPGVIARVSCLFKGHPELIVGFNTFLPPGYKIEVQCNDSTSRSNTVPGIIHGGAPGSMQTIVHTPQGVHTMGMHGRMTAIQPNSIAVATTMPVSVSAAIPRPAIPLASITPTTTVSAHPPSAAAVQNAQAQQLPVMSSKYAPNKPEAAIKGNLLAQQPTAHIPGYPLTIHPTHPGANNANATAAVAAAAAAANEAQHAREQQLSLVGSLTQPQQPPPQQQGGPVGAAAAAAANNQQPVEFNHAINYVNKIKNRFSGQPEVYKSFLEILHSYQKDQKAMKEGLPTNPHLTEAEVYDKVSKLFRNQEDLLSEFGQFLPEAGDPGGVMSGGGKTKKPSGGAAYRFPDMAPGAKYPPSGPVGALPGSVKRPPSGITHPPPKKLKVSSLRDVSLAEAGKYGTLNEFAFFDKVRKALRSSEAYNNFLRILVLFNQEIVSREELVQLASGFLGKHPELFKWFKDFVGCKDASSSIHPGAGGRSQHHEAPGSMPPQAPPGRERMSGDSAQEVDYATCKRLGASYCALPKTFIQPKCAGRTPLCQETLNDTWVSFPSWSEDSQFVTSRKTQYEECIYRTEDERFEFDVVLETNKDTIKVLECVQKKMTRMPPEEAARYRLDECLGGTSATIHQRAIRRIYGDKATDIIDGLKRNPVVAVPLVLKRLRAKDEEWREVQKNFNKVWREQNEKFYLKSLDHQSLNFKQTDLRNIRSKTLVQEIESLFDERHEQDEAGGAPLTGPHMTLDYHDQHILLDANNLLIHHVKRQTSIHKEDKHKIKVLLRHFLLDCFKQNRQDLSDDEREDDDEDDNDQDESDKEASANGKATRSERAKKKKDEKKGGDKDKAASSSSAAGNATVKKEITEADVKHELNKNGRKTPLHARDMDADESYTHMIGNNNWYMFFRLHHLLCERLNKMYNQSVIIAAEEAKDKTNRKESTAVALRLKPKSEVSPENYYPAFIDMVKNVLDGNMDSGAYEDTLREMFGIHAYLSFTLDKVVGYAVRRLQRLVTDEAAVECLDLFHAESKNGATGGTCGTAYDRLIPELVYQKRAEKALEEENCLKMFIYHQSQKVTIEMLDSESDSQNSEEQEGQAEADSKKVHTYIDRFVQPGEPISDACKRHLAKKPVFLPRGIRSYSKSSFAKKYAKAQAAAAAAANNHEGASKGAKSGKNNKKASNSVEEMDEGKSESDHGNDSESKDADSDAKESRVGGNLNNGVVINEDNTQCQFKPNSMEMVYVIKSENCFYRKGAITRAKKTHKQVSQRKFRDFNRWHSTWAGEHVSESAGSHMGEWFMGKADGQVPNKTTRVVKNDQDKTPYKTYCKYRAEIL